MLVSLPHIPKILASRRSWIVTTRRAAQRKKSRVDVEEVVDHVPRTELLVLDPSSRSAQQSQQRLHGVHTYGDETPGVGVLAPHARQGRRLGRWRGSGHRPPSPSLIYIGRTNGLLSHRPISNPNPSWINIHLGL